MTPQDKAKFGRQKKITVKFFHERLLAVYDGGPFIFLFGSNTIHDESLTQGCWTIKYELFTTIMTDLATINERTRND